MSGGSYNYAYRHVEEFAESLNANTPERKAFVSLLFNVAEAMHDIEWVDSGDYGKGDDTKAILECVNQANIQEVVLRDLAAAVRQAQTILGRAGA